VVEFGGVSAAQSTGPSSGGATFGWKYVVGGYENGSASYGQTLLREARSTFLFPTFGTK